MSEREEDKSQRRERVCVCWGGKYKGRKEEVGEKDGGKKDNIGERERYIYGIMEEEERERLQI